MASKSKKGASAAPPRQSSPLSPTRYSRMQEKNDLQNLNDRLASYIDKVRHLETENSRLTREVQTSQESITREVTNIKSMYDHELGDARKLLDETHREKARLEIDVKRLLDENGELKTDLAKRTKDLALADNSARLYESRYNDLQLKYNQANQDAKRALTELKDLEKERDKLRKLLEEHRKQLEEESLARVEVENSNQTLREELAFKDQVYQQQLTETRSKRQIEISEIDSICEQYEDKLQQALQELREQYESQMHINRQEIEALYEQKIKDLQADANRRSAQANGALDEIRQHQSRVKTLTVHISELEKQNSDLAARLRDIEKMLENERLRHVEEFAMAEQEISKLRDQMSSQLHDYQDLMDIKLSLDVEIAAYRKLLESEESRLNITPHEMSQQQHSRSSSQRRTPVRFGSKRKRTLLEETQEASLSDFSVNSSSKGDIEVQEVCPDGSFVKLHNKSGQEVPLGGWQVIRRVGDQETLFKFHRTLKLEAGGTVTIWSSDSNKDHEPPHNVVMKSQKWVIGDNMTTIVLNNSGEEIAISERVKRQLSSSVLRHREGFLGSEELHHQQGDPHGDEKCRLM